MKETIHNRLKQVLTARALALPEGAKFSTEHELCAEFGVSRMTINKVINELTGDGYLTRQRPRGTFVRHPVAKHRAVTTFLPTADYLSEETPNGFAGRRFYQGACSAVQELGISLETHILSVTAHRGLIDPAGASHLTADHRLFMFFIPWSLLRQLADSGAKAVLLDKQEDLSDEERKWCSRWQFFVVDRYRTVLETIGYLHATGSRNIALSCNRYGYPDHPAYRAYMAGAEKFGYPPCFYETNLNDPGKEMREYGGNRKIDTLLFDQYYFYTDTPAEMKKRCGLSPDVRLMSLQTPYDPAAEWKKIPYIHYPNEKIASDAVKFLADDESVPGKPVVYRGEIITENTEKLPTFFNRKSAYEYAL